MALGTQELAPHITLPKYNNDKDLVGRRVDKILWAIIMLQNVDTLEVYEDAMRQRRRNYSKRQSSKNRKTCEEGRGIP